MRETHQKGEVERQLLEEERAQLSEALARVRKRQLCSFDFCRFRILCVHVVYDLFVSLQVESRNAELSLLLNKLQSEDAALRDSLAKVGSLNEGLAQDKADLNTYILQVCTSCSLNAVTCTNEDKGLVSLCDVMYDVVCGHCILIYFKLESMLIHVCLGIY